MYECMDCGEEFERPVQAIDPDGGEHAEEIATCPACGSDDILEVEEYDDEWDLNDEEEDE